MTNAAPTASTVTFLALVPEYFGRDLPTCPDGSGDLWWDDASYAAYQSYEPDYRPAFIQDAVTDDFCDGVPTYFDGPACAHHLAEAIADDCPF